ncbi:Protein CBG19835 [Caenorhabditis briggsae]|uniref:Protein CBG19835 n=2 Tax=Caenorhabditis briggsae TaxID=6238 RepID=A8XWJ8_CAEBR|nr:Protein CBG19835 [Caenorhabditis briggsae]CAP37017.2 Protein CBG19835 [Caenorhabditis briggsae]
MMSEISGMAHLYGILDILTLEIIADLLSLIVYLIFKITTSVFAEYFFIQDVIPFAQIYFNSVYWSIVYRAHGIVLLTIHRYLVIVKTSSKLTHFILNEKPWLIWFRFWIPPTIFNFIFFLDTKIRFGMGQILIFAMDTLIVDRYAEVIIIFLSISCLICFVSYVLIIWFVRSKSNAMSQSIKRELLLALQMILPCFGLFVLQVYMSFLHCFATNDNGFMIQWIRGFFPLVNGIISFIGPVTILLFNMELSSKIKIILMNRKSISPSISLAPPRSIKSIATNYLNASKFLT